IFQPSAVSQKPRFSSHIGSNQAKGTYISTVWISFHGFLMPARSYTARAQTFPAIGLTWSRPGTHIASAKEEPERIHARFPRPFRAWASDARTSAQAPSDEGQVSR